MEEKQTSAKVRNVGDLLREFREHRDAMRQELAKVIIGQDEVVEQLFAAIFTRGHCLLEGVPGLAKTLMVSSLARILDVSFKRIQFTPDLMPSDITGTNVLDEDAAGKREFRFVEGPIFTNILLADEINRTPPKTQAALLQAMQEREVTVGRATYSLPEPFFTIATQNPIEQEGTYPLPEAQRDRFLFQVMVDYPNRQEESEIIDRTTTSFQGKPQPVVGGEEIVRFQDTVRRVPLPEHVKQYVLELVRSLRPREETRLSWVKAQVEWGPGPRAGQQMVLGAKARALLEGRTHVTLEDVRHLAAPVLRHRMVPTFRAQAEGITPDALVARAIQELPAPAARSL